MSAGSAPPRARISEGHRLRQIMLAAPHLGCRLFRNNTGVLKDARGRHVTFGLCVGSSDLIGWTTLPDTTAVFTAIEVKQAKGTKPTRQQTAFVTAVNMAGGIACIATSVEDVRAAITQYIEQRAARGQRKIYD